MSSPFLWRKWIKKYVCTATTSILVTGSPTAEFSLEKRLCHGDLLSPFLFLLATEGLINVLMQSMVMNHIFSGYSIGVDDLIYDDSLILGTKSWANVCALRVVLVLFEVMLSLKVNFHKSMLVWVNIPDSWLNAAATAFHCKVGDAPFLCLGIPIDDDLRRLGFREPVVTRIQKRLPRWKSRFLSFGGRLILLKFVLTSLLVYAFSFLKLPQVLFLLLNFF
jgi:hypothetical protein